MLAFVQISLCIGLAWGATIIHYDVQKVLHISIPSLDKSIEFLNSPLFQYQVYEKMPMIISTTNISSTYQVTLHETLYKYADLYEFGSHSKGVQVLGGAFYAPRSNLPNGLPMPDKMSGSEILSLLEDDATIVLGGVSSWNPQANKLAADISYALDRRTHINAYIAGSNLPVGTDVHNDMHCFTAVHMSGEKRWRLWDDQSPVLPNPGTKDSIGTAKSRAIDYRNLADPIVDVILQPGDILYVPRGMLHMTSTDMLTESNNVGDYSLHLTVAIAPDAFIPSYAIGGMDAYGIPKHDLFRQAYIKAVEQLSVRDVRFRTTIPYQAGKDTWKPVLKALMHDVVNEVWDNTTFPTLLDDHFKFVLYRGRLQSGIQQ